MQETSCIQVQSISSLEQWKSYKQNWIDLTENSVDGNIFFQPYWYEAWFEHIQAAKAKRVSDSDHQGLLYWLEKDGVPLVGIPLRIKSFGKRLLSVNYATAFFHEMVDYNHIPCRSGHDASFPELFKSIFEKHDLKCVFWKDIPEGSQSEQLLRSLKESGFYLAVEPGNVCPRVPLTQGSFEHYLKEKFNKPSKKKNRINRLKKYPGLEILTEKDLLKGEVTLEELVKVEQSSWKGAAGKASGLFSDGVRRKFYRDIIAKANLNGDLQLLAVRIEGELEAYTFGFYFQNKWYFYGTAQQGQYPRLSPGMVLMYLALEECFNRGLEAADLMRGVESYKRDLTSCAQQNLNIYVFKNPVYARLMRVGVWLKKVRKQKLGKLKTVQNW